MTRTSSRLLIGLIVAFLVYTTWVLVRNDAIDGFPVIDTARNRTISDRHERLVFVGDVHGIHDKYEELLQKKVKPDENTTVVLLGDFIYKGPSSKRIVEEVVLNETRGYNLECVLGNNELRVLYALLNPSVHGRLQTHNLIPFTTERFLPDVDSIKQNHRELAADLGWDLLSRVAAKCSGMLTLEDRQADNFTLVAVHAGVLPDHLSNPALQEITDMKYVDVNDHWHTSREPFENSTRWYHLWDALDSDRYRLGREVRVVYGHDAGRGLNLRHVTKGLDSACYNGNSLTALEYKWNSRTAEYNHILHQVSCRNAARHA